MSQPNPDDFFGAASTESSKKKRPNPDDYFGAVKPPKPPEPTMSERVAEVASRGLSAAKRGASAVGHVAAEAGQAAADAVRGLAGAAGDAYESLTSNQPPAPTGSVLEQPAPAGMVQAPQGGLTPQEMAAGEVSPEAAQRRQDIAAYQARAAAAPEARAEGLGESIGRNIREATSNPVARGLAAGFGGLAQTGIGLVRAGADAVGADDVSEFAAGASNLANSTSEGATRDLKGNDKLVADVFNSIAVSSPMLAAAVSGGGALPLLFGQSALAEYNTGRNRGFSPSESAARAGIMATAEVLGERFGLPEQVKLLKSLGNKVPTGELSRVASEMLLKDIPGEQLTTALQFLGDKYGPAAQNPQASLQDYLNQAGDTLAVTIGQAGVMGGGPVAAGAVRNAYAKADAAAPFVATPQTVASLANKYGISPKAASQMADMLQGMEPAQANAFVERALRGFESKGLARKSGAAAEFRSMVEQQAAAPGAEVAPDSAVTPDTAATPDAAATQPMPGQASADDLDAGAILGAPPATPALETPIDQAAHAAATSPTNDRAEPTDGQKKAGNYAVGRIKVDGMQISVENPQGSVRRGTDADGNAWETPLTAHYGYFSGTLAADGDKLDVFVKQGLPEDWTGPAFVVDQIDPKTGKFDEHKVVLGAQNEHEARDLYLSNYSDGWQGLGDITRLPMPAFKAWAKSGHLKTPLGDIAAAKRAPDAEGAAVQSTNLEKGAPDEVNQQPSLSPSAAAPAALDHPATAVKPAKIRNHPNSVRGSGALAEVSKSLGGISPSLLADLSQKTTRIRTSRKTGKKTQFTTWDNPAIPGVGPLFRAGGTSDLTELARVLEESGYMPAGTLERDYLAARSQAQDIIKAELSDGGSSLRVGDPEAVSAEMRRRSEKSAPESDPWWEAGIGLDDLQESGYLQADELTKQLTEQLVLQAEGLGIDIDTIREDVARQVGDEATGNDYEAAVQQSIQQAIDRSAGASGQGDSGAEGPGGQDGGATAEPSRRARGDGADRPDQTVQGQREELTLQAETEAQAQAKAEREQAALEAERQAKEAEQARLKKTQADREARARADATVDHFELGQSADQQMAGQDDLFSSPEQVSHPNPAEGAKATEAPKVEKKPSRKQAGKDAERRLADYFTPGNILKKYGGHDEVLAFKPGKDGAWSVQVQAVRKVDGQWVREGKPQDARWHSTMPDARDLKTGPVERLGHVTGKDVPYSEPRGDGKPFTNAPDRGALPLVIPQDGWRGDLIKTRDYAKRLLDAGKLDAEQAKASWGDPDALASLIDAGTTPQQDQATEPKTSAKTHRTSSLKAEAGDSEKVRQAKADALRAIADIADILGKPTRLNIMPEEEQRLLPALTRLMDAAFTLGYLKFKEAARFTLDKLRELAGDEVANKVTLDHLQGAYIGMAGRHRDEGAERPAQVAAVESLDEITQNDPEGVDHVPSTDTSVERGGRNAAAEQPFVGGPVRQEGGGIPSGVRADRERGGQADTGRDGDAGIHADGPTAAGKSGDQPLSGSDAGAEPAGRNAGVDDDPRGGGFGDGGIQSAAKPAGQAGNAVDPGTQLARKLKAQRDAESIPTVRGDADNIAATLPFLLPGQVEDVHKAESRFEQDDGYGMMFTNQPGTGKTFTGLGVVKRFSRQGANNILILAPTDKVIDDWITSAAKLNLTVSKLPDTKSAGAGIVATTYANFGQNEALVTRAWDLVVPDESHYLMQEKDGSVTGALLNLRAISLHPDGAYERASRLHADLLARARELSDAASMGRKSDDERQWHEAEKLQAQADALYAQFNKAADDIKEYVATQQGKARTRVLFLSATPFAWEKTIDYAQGYLFDYGDASGSGYNSGDGREQFFMQHFGYRMRYNKLTRPDANVDSGLIQRQFNSWLKSRGVLSSRMLDVEADYDRRFQLVESAIGARIDEALEWVSEQRRAAESSSGFSLLADALDKRFDFLSRRYLLEAIKAAEVVQHVRANLDAGRKVVVFHDYKKGGGFNPFELSHVVEDGEGSDTELAADFNRALGEFHAQFPDLVRYPFETMPSPISLFQREFPGVLLFNGDVKPADRRAAVAKFQDDASGPQVILVQSAAGKEGISLHDTTGKHQRVLFNLGLPTRPTTAIQQEGRIYRTGQVTDAIIRYLNTGTNWEKWAFATTIAQRASTTENLGLGEMARALKDGFIAAFEESGDFPVGHEGEGKGGKERDRAANNALSDWDRARSFYFGTQKKDSRTKAKEGADYFATPEPLGLKMVQWLDLRSGEDFAEPSAGHGAIARWAPDKVNATAVEPSTTLRSRLAMVFSGKIVPGDFESLHVGANKFDGIAMNPPFGTAGRLAVDHLAKATDHLREGGRVACILPDGPATEKKFDAWFYAQDDKGRQLHPDLHLVATIKLPRVAFERAGTSVATRIVVIDKLAKDQTAPLQVSRDYSDITDIRELFDRMEGAELPKRTKPQAPQPTAAEGIALRANDARQAAKAEKAQAQAQGAVAAADAGLQVVTHVTGKGKTIKGVIRTDLTKDQAQAIDAYTWKKNGGWFIRLEHLDKLLQAHPVAGGQQGSGPRPVLSRTSSSVVASRSDERTPVATLTGQELGAWGDMRELERLVSKWYEDNLVKPGKSVVNKDTGWAIGFDGTGRKKVSGRKVDVLLRIVPALRQIIEGGRLLSSEPDNRSRSGIKAIHKFGATVMLDGHPRDVVATIRETVNGTFHYDLSKDGSDGARFLPADAGYKSAARMPQGAETGHGKEGSAATTGNVGGNGETGNPVKASLAADLNLDFSEQQADGMPAEKLQAMVDRVSAQWSNAPTVRVAKGLADLPPEIQQALREQRADTTVRALYLPTTGEVWLLADRLKDEADAQRALFHEVLGHFGMRGFLGTDYAEQMQLLQRANPALAREAANWVRANGAAEIRARVAGGMSFQDSVREVGLLAVEEALAERAEAGATINMWGRVMAKLQASLRRIGLDSVADLLERMSQAETAALLANARKYVEGGMVSRAELGKRMVMSSTYKAPDRVRAPTNWTEAAKLLIEAGYRIERTPEGAPIVMRGKKEADFQAMPSHLKQAWNVLSVDDENGDWEADQPLLSRTPSAPQDAGEQVPTVQADPIEGRNLLASYKGRVQRALDRADRVMNGLGELPDTDTFLAQRYRALGRIAQIDKIAEDIRAVFRKALPSDKRAVYEYLTNADATTAGIASPEVASTAERVKRYINTVGDQLVLRGLLPESAREEYRDRYLPRMYLAHLLDEPSWRQIGAGKKVSDLGYLKKRKDIPQEIRDVLLGEVKDPAFLAANAIAKPMRDMALLDWLGQISQHEQWIHPASMAEWAGQRVSAFWLKAEAKALRERALRYPEEVNREQAMAVADAMDTKALQALDGLELNNADFKQMPDTPRYGRLRGMLVRREIYDDLMGSRDFVPDDPGWAQRLLGFGGVGTKVTQVWKMSKVSLNIPGQIRNMVSNAVMLQLSGVPLHRLPVLFARAMRQVRANGMHWQIAKKYGVTESTFSAQELYRARRDLLELERDMRGMSWWNAIKSLAALVGDKAGDAYQFVEAVHKTVKIIDAMERQGLTEDKAALEAQKWLFDYSLVNRNVRYARNAPVGAPFITFTAKVAPRLAEVALLHPQRFLPWVALMYGMQAWAMSMFGGDDDEWEKLKHALPKWMQEKGHIAFLPFRDDAGRLQAADLSYFFPWSQWSELAMDMAHGDLLGAVKSLGVFSGPIPDLLTAIKTNEDAFTGRQIVNPGDPLPQRAASVLIYLYDMAAPPMISSNGVVSPMWLFGPEYGGKLAQAATGATNKLGDQKATVWQALIRLGGLNVYGIDPELTRAANLMTMMHDMSLTQKAMQSKLQNQGLTPEQQKFYADLYQSELIKRQEEFNKYDKESEVPDFAKRTPQEAVN